MAAATAAVVTEDLPPGEKIDAALIAEPFREEVKTYIQEKLGGVGPKMVGLLANNDPAAKKYADWTGRACARDGIRYEVRECTKEDLETKLEEANADPDVHGIMVYYPVFGAFPSFYGGTMDDYLRDSISHEKDVEGLCHLYRRNLYRNVRYVDAAETQKCILPCTPLSCVKILEHLAVYDAALPVGARLEGKVVTIINRSEIVGRPLAAMLANDGATIYSIDIDSIYEFRRGRLVVVDETAEGAIRRSHAVICGVPSRDYKLVTEWVQPGTVVVNVSTFKNVHEEELLQVPGVKYVPMVGKVTVAMLERNLLRLHGNFAAARPSAAKKAKLDNGEA
eukprot:TRINITY_DN29009_c0_g1_i1.p2 TRINITY_DN29009_c0_g1~~TRINITY_DN29009_c0_g1_i1.p2  ORF type:complete len:337 (-),score=118.05 TRINITY_DN29009_c0_g1_i1:308-1318(-)